jgi:serine/threonine-protein kinase HipA
MKLEAGEPLHAVLAYGPNDNVPVGRLALDGRQAVFGYDEAFIAGGQQLVPGWPTPDRSVVRPKNPRAFQGLHGAFADSLPDAWGQEIMRRRAAERGLDYDGLSALDRLALVGHTGVGALIYRPDYSDPAVGNIDLDALAAGSEAVLTGSATTVVEQLAALGGSSGGARPKVFVARNAAGHTIGGTADIPDGYAASIVKFRGSMDRRDIGPLEAAYADMARAAGIDVSPTVLIPASGGAPGYFATCRFDRTPANGRVHVLSVAAILDVDWSQPAIDYTGLLSMVTGITRDFSAVEQMFRRMAFNVLAINRDDHTKQFAFMQTRAGEWQLAPAYDLTLSPGPGGEHYLAVNGKGKNITVDDILSVAKAAGIKPPRARAIVEDVRGAVAQFGEIAKRYGVSGDTCTDFRRLREA